MTLDAETPEQPWAMPAPGLPWSSNTAQTPPPAPVAVPVAWLGRTSDEDAQDPTLSLPRQLRNARAALPPGWVIVAHFYDVESGRKELDQRGHGTAHERFAVPIPRDGGIADLLEEAKDHGRRFAAVICESIERVARRTYFGTKIEYELERNGVALCAADEPIITDPKAKRATPTLTRRVKQAVAEWCVLQMLELSWDGFVEHTKQGWNVGKPAYGYIADRVPHPVPARRAEGRTKHRLIPDPVRGPVVTEIFRLRALDKLGYRAIAERLNTDLHRYPPPEPVRPNAACGQWSLSAVRGILENPKYTGYQVWNRKARKKTNRNNPINEWIWSPQPTHEPLVTREMFDAASPVAKMRQGSRTGSDPNSHPQTKRTYILRSYVICTLCGRRMYGKTRKGLAYYACETNPHHHRNTPWFATHPKSLWIGEKVLIGAVHDFFATRIFGPHRQELLAAELTHTAQNPQPLLEDRIEALQAQIAQLATKQARLMDELTNVDDEDPATAAAYRKAIRERFKTMERDRVKLQQEVDTHRAAHNTPGTNTELLDILPELTTRLGSLTAEDQRELYDAFQLQIHYNRPRSEALIKITINSATADDLAQLTQPKTQPTATRHAPPCQGRECRTKPCTGTPEKHETHATRASHVLRAPGRSRMQGLVVPQPL